MKNPKAEAMSPPNYTVRCSCGRSTTITWGGHCYVSLSPGWTASYPEGWHCSPGHTQRPTGFTLRPETSLVKKLEITV